MFSKIIAYFVIFVSFCFFTILIQQKVEASCSVRCYPSATSCKLYDNPCGESLAGCASGRTNPATQSWCCPYTVVCTCTPTTCSGCTPTCPTGQTTTGTGPLCVVGTNSSCTGTDGCNPCTLTGTACYYEETNTTFMQSDLSTDGPSSVSMLVDGEEYTLSTDPENPTHIKLPASGSSNVQVSVPTFTAPTTSRGANYYFQANNYGTNDQWKTWTTC